MRTLIIIGRVVRIGLQGFVRHAWLTLAAIMVMVVALTMTLTTIVLHVGTQNAIEELSQNLRVTVYLADGVEADDTAALHEHLAANPAVVDIEFLDPLQARENFLSYFDYDPAYVEAFELAGADEILSPSIRVSLNDIDQIEVVGKIATLTQYEDIVINLGEEDSTAQIAIERAQSAQRFFMTASLSLAIVLATVSCFTIFNTIRITIFSRRSEIEIMRLVGARAEFIRGLFLVEACLAGLIAGLLAVALVYVGLELGRDWLLAQPQLRPTYEMFQQSGTVWQMVVGSCLGGIGVGLASSYWATRRHLRLTD